MKSSADWDSASLRNDTRAWFVTKWDGKCAGSADCDLLFVIEIPRSHCLCLRLFGKSGTGWEREALCNLVLAAPSPDALITDMTQLLPTLVSVGASLQEPATPYLDKPITLMPAIGNCIKKVADFLNEPSFLRPASVEKRNDALEAWRVKYNETGRVF